MTDFNFAAFSANKAVLANDRDGAGLVGKLATDTSNDAERTESGGFINQQNLVGCNWR